MFGVVPWCLDFHLDLREVLKNRWWLKWMYISRCLFCDRASQCSLRYRYFGATLWAGPWDEHWYICSVWSCDEPYTTMIFEGRCFRNCVWFVWFFSSVLDGHCYICSVWCLDEATTIIVADRTLFCALFSWRKPSDFFTACVSLCGFLINTSHCDISRTLVSILPRSARYQLTKWWLAWW